MKRGICSAAEVTNLEQRKNQQYIKSHFLERQLFWPRGEEARRRLSASRAAKWNRRPCSWQWTSLSSLKMTLKWIASAKTQLRGGAAEPRNLLTLVLFFVFCARALKAEFGRKPTTVSFRTQTWMTVVSPDYTGGDVLLEKDDGRLIGSSALRRLVCIWDYTPWNLPGSAGRSAARLSISNPHSCSPRIDLDSVTEPFSHFPAVRSRVQLEIEEKLHNCFISLSSILKRRKDDSGVVEYRRIN